MAPADYTTNAGSARLRYTGGQTYKRRDHGSESPDSIRKALAPNPGLALILSSKEVAFVVNPYEAPATIPGISEKFIVDAQTLSIMRKPGLAMAIQGWILAAIYCVGLLVVLLLGERRDLLEMGIPFLIVLILAIQLARCGKSTMRFESRQMAYVGALLSILLFLPLGIFICLWIASSLNRVEILDAKRRNLVDQ